MAITICDKITQHRSLFILSRPGIKMHIRIEPLVYRLLNAPEKLTVQVLSESSTVNHCQS